MTFVNPISPASPGLKTEVKLAKQGPGRLYYATRMQYAPAEDNARRINAGIELRREYAVERDGRRVLLRSAFVISEDKRFFDNDGIDWRARISACRQNIRAWRAVRGASTATEQVVRMLHPRTLWSRWLEGFEARP